MQQQEIVAMAKMAHHSPMSAFKKSHMGKLINRKPPRRKKSTKKY